VALEVAIRTAGGSECLLVMRGIEVATLLRAKASRLPSGVSSHENLVLLLIEGEQEDSGI